MNRNSDGVIDKDMITRQVRREVNLGRHYLSQLLSAAKELRETRPDMTNEVRVATLMTYLTQAAEETGVLMIAALALDKMSEPLAKPEVAG